MSDLLHIVNNALNEEANKKAAHILGDIRSKLYYRTEQVKEFKSKYEKKAYRSAMAYIDQERKKLLKIT